jgi:hypothetical protein
MEAWASANGVPLQSTKETVSATLTRTTYGSPGGIAQGLEKVAPSPWKSHDEQKASDCARLCAQYWAIEEPAGRAGDFRM